MSGLPIIPRSAIHHPHSRAALTLAEVLIAMGILTVGLLGVASVFPVGGFYMQSGDIADQAGAIAQAALDDAIIRGHLDPENWVLIDFDNVQAGGPIGARYDGAASGQNSGSPDWLAQSLRDLPGKFANQNQIAGLFEADFRNKVYGAAYVIDPIGMAAALNEDDVGVWQRFNGTIDSKAARRFPASKGIAFDNDLWGSWVNVGQSWPVRRVTTTFELSRPAIAQFANTFRLLSPAALDQFTADSDLAETLPDSGDEPARQRWEAVELNSAGDVIASTRQTRGDYSWIISVSPGSPEARDALATAPDAYPYEVSVAVFHKRVALPGQEGALESERLVRARVVSTGVGGGELLLVKRANDNIETSPFEDLREGQYVLVMGPHPLSTLNRPRFVMQWHRVLNLRDEGRSPLPGGSPPLDRESQVLASLRGPDWPWQAAADITTDGPLANDLRVAVLPGVVAVHTKTMRLESGSEWSID